MEVTGGAEFVGNMELCGDAQKPGGWRVEVTGELAGDAELAGNAELGGDAQRAWWGQHVQRWRRGRVGAVAATQRVG